MAKKKTTKSSVLSSLNTVTSFSKITAAVLFIALPMVAFYLGMNYQRDLDMLANPSITPVVIMPF